jgi:GNAT superfamily N-acetyltransferase
VPAPFLRPAAPADSDAIGLIHVQSWQSAYRDKIPQDYLDGLDPAHRSQVWRRILEQGQPSRGGVLVTVAEGGSIVGFASFGPSRDGDADPRVMGEVLAMSAAPDAWGTGAGRAIMGDTVTELARAGYTDATLWVLDANDQARRFYALSGWAEDGATRTDGSRGFDITEVRYRKTLPQTGCTRHSGTSKAIDDAIRRPGR